MINTTNFATDETLVSAVMLKVSTLIEKRTGDEPCAEAEADLLHFLRTRLAAPQAAQAAVPLPLLVRDIARDLGITVPQACIALKPLGNYSTNSAVTAEMARMLRDHFPAPAHPAEGVPAQKVHPFGWFITKSKLSGDTEFTQDPVRENLARSFGYQTKALYTHPTQQGMDAATLDALQEAESVLNSINMGKQHRVVQADGEVTYWQREEWCKWAAGEVLPKVTAAIAAQAKQGGADHG